MKSQISKLIPKGKGYNIAEFYKNGGKKEGLFARSAKEALEQGAKTTMIQCTCCTRQVLGVIVETGGVKDPIPLHMPCNTCGKWLGHLEVDNLKNLDGMCLECFTEEIE
jgi:hypothetical protein